MLAENFFSFCQGCADRSGNQVFFGHDVTDAAAHVFFKAHITVGDDADKFAIDRDGDAGDAVLAHQFIGISQEIIGMKENRVDDDAVFRPFYFVDFPRLGGDGHVLMNNADTTFAGNGNSHRSFCNGIHTRAHNRNIQFDIARQVRRNVDFLRKHVGFCRNQENVIKCQTSHTKFIRSHICTSVLKNIRN